MNLDFNNKESVSLTNEYLEIWWDTRACFPDFKNRINLINQYRNERKLERFRKELTKKLKEMDTNQVDNGWSTSLLSIIKTMESNIVGYENSCIDFFAQKGYSRVTEGFVNEANEFDPQMDIYDVFQAIRNVWIMNSIQILLNQEVALTPSVFAYSMLYPYSDNYLDNANIQVEDKIAFNNRFRKWLVGEPIGATNQNEDKVYELVKKIEGQFPRDKYKQVFDALLSIHTAQEKSLIQQRQASLPNEKNIIGITFEKGGASVLTDGYLVKGHLSEQEAYFMFGYGVFLQLIDDLQDVVEDHRNGHMTLFSQIAFKYPLDRLTNKLFWFIDEVLINRTALDSADKLKLRNVIYESCRIMIFEAISKNQKLYSRRYIKEVEQYSMLRFGYYKKMKKKFQNSLSSKDLHRICNGLVQRPLFRREES
ncbi:hypothetical protein [Alkaliphilus hydrothermalis]|uniref:Uncharacterized protein n=1 Tax=Alkaliphilus hydrothermalis TaxID=1482730 RepID=A0ABS2NQX2_9FIRM|nr:hypothetical protein [Alkaliphilus hydrothermalis]MBM7614964.1 hypothetical protein [Alkaliphilus hydrothermalis]